MSEQLRSAAVIDKLSYFSAMLPVDLTIPFASTDPVIKDLMELSTELKDRLQS